MGSQTTEANDLSFGGTDRFEVLSFLGQGAAGFVYEVMDRERNLRLALKTLRARQVEALLNLKNEFRAAQGLDHPNIVALKELFEDRGRWFFTMEYVPGRDFLSYVRPSSEKGLDEGRLRLALAQLAKGLCVLHAHHKIHRDIKPSNVLVTTEGRVVLLDFGILAEVEGDGAYAADEGMVGTAAYMAPEQAASEPVGPAADWYAVGTLLYQSLTGRLPFAGSMQQILEAKLTDEPAAPASVARGVPHDLNDLCVELLKSEPQERPEGLEVLRRLGIGADDASLSAAQRLPFVGRRAELLALENALERTREGKCATVLVEGESGVGKSHLVREFTTRARTDAVLVFRGRCYERESVPYKAFDTIIDDLSRFLSSIPEEEALRLLPEQAALLRRPFPVLEQVPAIASARITSLDTQDPQEARARVFGLLRSVFDNVARKERLVLVIDDLQWADSDSLALLTEMLRPPDAPPFLLLATLRTGTESRRHRPELYDAIDRLPGDVRYVRLEALPPADARDLIARLLEGASQGSAAAESILTESKGHPLFIDELVRHFASHQDLTVPSRLDDALWERAAALGVSERRLLELVAVAGVPMPQETIARAAALEHGQLFELVSTLRSRHFVRTSGVYRKDTIEPYHDRVRESVIQHLENEQRKDWHAKLALALEQSDAPDAEMLATHWQAAGDRARAAGYSVRAAEQAASALAFDHAASLYRAALELSSVTGDERRDLEVKLAEALANAGQGGEAGRVFLEAAGSGESDVAVDLKRRAAEQFMRSGHLEQGVEVNDSVLRAVGCPTLHSRLLLILSIVLQTLWIAVRGLAYRRRSVGDLRSRDLLRLECIHSAGSALGMSDNVRARELLVRNLRIALQLGEPFRVGRALAFFGCVVSTGGDKTLAKTLALADMVENLAREVGSPWLSAAADSVKGYGYMFTGRWSMAKDFLQRAEEGYRERCVGVYYELNSLRTLLYRVLVTTGDFDELRSLLGDQLREAEQRNDLYSIINFRSWPMLFLALVRDDEEAAARELDLASRHLAKNKFIVQHAYCLIAEANLGLYRGRIGEVERRLDAMWPTVKRSMLLRIVSLRMLLLDVRARAYVALAASRSEGSARALHEADNLLRRIEREKTIWMNPQAALSRAGLASLQGRRDEALLRLAEAERGFEAASMPLQAAVVKKCRGDLLGGNEGEVLRKASEVWMAAHGIVDADKMIRMYAPGFDARSRGS